jgi:hypothetical protein
MTIEPGAPWGQPGALPDDGVVVASDADVRALVERCRRENEPLPVIGLLGGDLCKTLGGTGDRDRLHSDHATTLPVDVAAVLLDGRLHWFVAHLVARRGWWRGPLTAVMNAQWLGHWDVAPRAHPGDGQLDIVQADLPFGDRLEARRRIRTGTHIPHPDIDVRRASAWQTELTPAVDVWLDGEKVGRARNLSVRVEPGALTVVI